MKLRFILFVLVLGFTFLSCRNNQDKNSYIPPAAMEYSGQDTSEVMALVNKYIECLNTQDYDGMVDMLYLFKDNRIHAYEGTQRDSVKHGLQQIPVYAAKLHSFKLRSNVNNEVGILIQLLEDGDLDNEVGVSKLYLNPVIIDGKWYLTLLDLNADGVRR